MGNERISDDCREKVCGALTMIRTRYNHDLRFSTNIQLFTEITIQYGYPSETTVLRISQSALNITIKVDEHLGSSVQPRTLQWSSTSESEIANEIRRMYEDVITEKGWSMSGPLKSRLDTINVQCAPRHGMDNPKIAALDVEIKRSKNKLKYMEAQLFPKGVPTGKSSGH